MKKIRIASIKYWWRTKIYLHISNAYASAEVVSVRYFLVRFTCRTIYVGFMHLFTFLRPKLIFILHESLSSAVFLECRMKSGNGIWSGTSLMECRFHLLVNDILYFKSSFWLCAKIKPFLRFIRSIFIWNAWRLMHQQIWHIQFFLNIAIWHKRFRCFWISATFS